MTNLTDIMQLGRTYTGAEINAANLGWLVKLTSATECHNNLTFKTGLNRDAVPFAPRGGCSAGGMYFCRAQDAGRFFEYNGRQMAYVRTVTLPDDALVYVEKHKLKTNVYVLGPRATIHSHAELLNVLVEAGAAFDPNRFDNTLFTDDVLRRLLRQRTLAVCRTVQRWDYSAAVLPRALTEIQELLELAAAVGLLVQDLPKEKRTREMLHAAIGSQCFHHEQIKSYFPLSLISQLPVGALVPLGAPITDVPPEARTHELLMQVVQSSYINSCIVANHFEAPLFTPKVYACLAANPHATSFHANRTNLPAEHLTTDALHRLVHCDRHRPGMRVTKYVLRRIAATFPSTAFTPEICNTLILQLNASPEYIPPACRTRALFDDVIRQGARKPLRELMLFDPAFMDDAALALIAAELAAGTRQDIGSNAPSAVRCSRALLSIVVTKRYWNNVYAFDDSAFDQSLCNTLVADGFLCKSSLGNIPLLYRTIDMYVEAVHHGFSLNQVPYGMLEEVKCRIAQQHAAEQAAKPKRAIQKKRKRHDWASRKRT